MTSQELEIYDVFYDMDSSDSQGVIRLYEKNQLLLDNKSTFQTKDDFDDFLILLGCYVLSLEKMGKYSKAVKYSDKFLHLVDAKKDEFGIDLQEDTTYWNIMALKGRALYRLKDYRNSIAIFQKLLEWDSENDNFRSWIHASKSRIRNSINKYLYILALVLIATVMLFGDQIDNPKIALYIKGLGFIMLMAALINEYVMDKILKLMSKD